MNEENTNIYFHDLCYLSASSIKPLHNSYPHLPSSSCIKGMIFKDRMESVKQSRRAIRDGYVCIKRNFPLNKYNWIFFSNGHLIVLFKKSRNVYLYYGDRRNSKLEKKKPRLLLYSSMIISPLVQDDYNYSFLPIPRIVY